MLLGLYRHYKGGLYLIESVARHSETLEEMVVYRSLYGDFGIWIRPKTIFESKVEYEGQLVNRFTYLRNPSEEPPTPTN